MKKYLIEAEAVGNSGPDRPFKGAYADFGDEMPVCMVMPRGQLMPLIRATEVTAIKQNREHEHEMERMCNRLVIAVYWRVRIYPWKDPHVH